VLDQLWESVLSVPGGQISDLFRALLILLAESDYRLTPLVDSFFHAIMLVILSRHEPVYEAEGLDWMLEEADKGLTPAQAYFFIHGS
jgi:hypothetical protein